MFEAFKHAEWRGICRGPEGEVGISIDTAEGTHRFRMRHDHAIALADTIYEFIRAQSSKSSDTSSSSGSGPDGSM